MVAEIDAGQIEAATNLLHRFFCEEGFADGRELIRTNLDALRTIPIMGWRFRVNAKWLAL